MYLWKYVYELSWRKLWNVEANMALLKLPKNISQDFKFRIYTFHNQNLHENLHLNQTITHTCFSEIRSYRSYIRMCLSSNKPRWFKDFEQFDNCVINKPRTELWVRAHYLYDRWEASDAGSSDAGESWNSGSQYHFLVARIDRLPTACYTPKYRDNATSRSKITELSIISSHFDWLI